MAATSSSTVFAADDVDAATSQVTEGPPVVVGSIGSPAECKLFMSIPSCGCSPVPIVPTPSKRKEGFSTQLAMMMTTKKTTTLNMSVAESEAKLEGSACHPLVGAETTSTLMTRCLILAICSKNLSRTLFHKLSTHEAVKKSSTRNYQYTPYSSPHRISTSTNTTHTIIKEGRRVSVPKTGRTRRRDLIGPDCSGQEREKTRTRRRDLIRPGRHGKTTRDVDWSGLLRAGTGKNATGKNPNTATGPDWSGQAREKNANTATGPHCSGQAREKNTNTATGPHCSGQAREKTRKTDSEKDRSELLIRFQDCEHKLHLNFQDLGYQAQRFVFCQNIRQRNLRSFQEKIMCANNKTTPIERGQEIEVLVIEGGWKENYKFFHACDQPHPVLL